MSEEFDPPQTPTPGPEPGPPPTPPPAADPPAADPPPLPPPSGPSAHGYGPPPTAAYGGQVGAPAKTNGKAVASLVLSIAGLIILPIVFSTLGIVFGALARKELKASPGAQGGQGMANWGFWLGIIGLVLGIPLAIFILANQK